MHTLSLLVKIVVEGLLRVLRSSGRQPKLHSMRHPMFLTPLLPRLRAPHPYRAPSLLTTLVTAPPLPLLRLLALLFPRPWCLGTKQCRHRQPTSLLLLLEDLPCLQRPLQSDPLSFLPYQTNYQSPPGRLSVLCPLMTMAGRFVRMHGKRWVWYR